VDTNTQQPVASLDAIPDLVSHLRALYLAGVACEG
jgi:hypothetical protein